MYDAVERSGPLAGFSHELLVAEGTGDVVLGPCEDQGKLLIRISRSDRSAHPALAEAFAAELPARHARMTKSGRLLAMAPGDWLWHGPDAEIPVVKDRVRMALASGSTALIDMSAGLVGLQVQGRRARELLQAGCPVDLSETVFQKGHVARSLFRRYAVTVSRCAADDEFILYVARSYARSLCASMIAQSAHWGVSWAGNCSTPKAASRSHGR